MVDLAELEGMQYARSLIEAGLRLSIIRAMTGVSTSTLRSWWREIHGVKPSNGKLPESVVSYIRDSDTACALAAFVALHQRLHGLDLSPKSLLDSWKEFQLITGHPIDINAAYYAVRDVKSRIVSFPKCHVCHVRFIYDASGRNTDRCPFCKTKVV
ncbi:hypothetical protein Hthe01_18990 [Hydrogenophilus thermoluteolus]|uniref:FlhC family transcriptional regulator n=1 Tax=Hydrogenophilus thermoluteolus TaxID=297 RepID=UPI0024A1836A|nr:FlhC family transcriptional regulator [Hydrogenophilus thermoluteolus]GLW61550.1 hypothetical protein Hthe01_18990 [Hydrogenophilus thermoluteolus]